jgi:hypothetical protein
MNTNMNHSHNSIGKDSATGINKNERFAKLYEKISLIQVRLIKNYNK